MRAELYMRGITPGRLGSFRDVTLRGMLVKEKTREIHKVVATMASSFNNADSAKEQLDLFVDASLYQNIKSDRKRDMVKYYEEHVKDLTPEITRGEDGEAIVRGLQ